MWEGRARWQAVRLEGLELELEIGAFAHERGRRQRVRVDVTLYRDDVAYTGGGLDACLNYDLLYQYLLSLAERPHVALVEALMEDVLAFCLRDGRVEAARVRIAKLDVYGGRAVPALEVQRDRN